LNYENLVTMLNSSNLPYDMDVISRAYELADNSHNGQVRLTGDPYITHPIAVAALLVELGMDTESVAAALLHDVVEDTKVSLEEVEKGFGNEIMQLVDGVTKLGKIEFSSMEEQQAENLRKMLLAMSQDIRVMLIKLCDRLHNMRTAEGWSEQKQRDKALETMEVYAPIAHRLGINTIKEELEDISLQKLDPVGYDEIETILNRDGDAKEFVAKIAEEIGAKLEEYNVNNAQIESRVKSIYGIYRKLFIQNRSLEEIYDIYAVRILVDTMVECYNALGVVHDMYHPIPSRFKDYISTPKANLYQSLHTTVISAKTKTPFEVQIRTWEMHQMAEYGVAAHWKYKEGISGSDKLEERLAWVRQLLESQRESQDSVELLRDIKGDLSPEDVFVFTPKGAVINLPAGANVIDFAYAIHSAVGNRMVGAKVNGRIVPIDYIVSTGEIIEVLLGPEDKGPSRDWLKTVVTSSAKSRIRNWFKKERREENIEEGKNALEKDMRRNMIHISDGDWDEFMEEIAKRQRLNNAEELYAAIGYGGLQLSRVMVKVKDEYDKRTKTVAPIITTIEDVEIKKARSNDGVIVEGLDNCLVKFSKCCNPLPGDDIIGFVTRGYGVSIHKMDCKNVNTDANDENASRWLRAYWEDGLSESFKSTIEILALDRGTIFADISNAVNNMRLPIFALNARQKDNGQMTITITIGINNTEHLKSLIAKLQKVKDVLTISRI
jgi:(p)ppGpp synthetase, RelA/SpoT family